MLSPFFYCGRYGKQEDHRGRDTLIPNRAFVDGNKRIGMYVMLTFLEVNGIRLEATNEEVAEVGLAVAQEPWGTRNC